MTQWGHIRIISIIRSAGWRIRIDTMSYIDKFLNSITMYRLVLYGLFALAALGIGLSAVGALSLSVVGLLVSLVIFVAACALANWALGAAFKIPVNAESSYITALILFLILPPVRDVQSAFVAVLVAVLAMASKFVLNIRGKHIFNPAALAVFLISLGGIGVATWWVGSKPLVIPVAILGLLVAHKVRRMDVFLSFALFALAALALDSFLLNVPVWQALTTAVLSGPLIFFGAIMLTEPLTLPPTRSLRYIYGGIVGLLYGTTFHVGPLYSSPELSLLIGNIYSYFVSPKQRLILYFKERIQISPLLYDFVFTPNQKTQFRAGQYWDWTLGHPKPDLRGNRRFFTIASSPTEPDIRLGVKIPEKSSTFKQALLALKPGDVVLGGQLAGDFVLPEDLNKKIVGIAGGIGVTPFRSIVKDRIDRGVKTNMVLFYTSADAQEFAYKDVFKAGEQVGIKTVYVLSGAKVVPPDWKGPTGFLTKEMIESNVPDWQSRLYYLSGPNVMVVNYKKLLRSMGVPQSAIHTDYFPGY